MTKKGKKSSSDGGGTLLDGIEAYGMFQIYVSIGFSMIIGLICLYFAISYFMADNDKMVTTTGVVLEDSTCTDETCTTKIEYTDRAGETYTIYATDSNKRYVRGHSVEIEYPEGSPSNGDFCCKMKNNSIAKILFGVSLFFFASAGISFYLRNNKFYRKAMGMSGAVGMMSSK